MFIDFLIYFSYGDRDYTGVVTQREENGIPYYRIVLKCEGKLSILRIICDQSGIHQQAWKHKQKKISARYQEAENVFLRKIGDEIQKHLAVAVFTQ